MVNVSWFRKRKRELTRADVERLIERGCPRGSNLDKLRWLLDWAFQNSSHSHKAVIARAGRLGIGPDWADRLLSGEVTSGFGWGPIEVVFIACGAPPAATEVARTLFHQVPRLGSAPPAAAAAARRPRPDPALGRDKWTGQICAVIVVDVVDFSARTDQDRKAIRRDMYRIVRSAFATSGISPENYYSEDRGDGILIVISPHVPTKHIVHRLLALIVEALSRHNAGADDGTPFKLRVALHAGPVESDADGVNGQAIIDAFRMIEARVFKQKLGKAPPEICLGFIASEFVYNSVIKQHPGYLSPDKYEQISVRVKKSRLKAWIKLAPDIPGPEPADEQVDP